IVQPRFMSELEHSSSNPGSAREEVFKEFQVLFRVGWKLKENRPILLSKRSQCDSQSLGSFDRSLPEFQNVSNLSRCFERELEIVTGFAGPRFYHREAWRGVERTVDLNTVEPLRIIG